MMKHKILVLPLLLSANLFALDINSAIDTALKNNFSLKQQQYSVDERVANLALSKSGYKPSIDLSYSYNNRDKLITGQIKEDSTVSAAISYNLFNGFYDKYNIKANQEQYDYSKYIFKAATQDLVLNVKSAYIDYLLKQKQNQTQKDALELYKTQYKDSKNFFDQGIIAKNELLEVEVEMLGATQRVQSAKAALKIAKQKLENIMGKTLETSETIDELEKGDISVDLKEENLKNRSEIKALESINKSYTNMIQTVRSNYYPKVDASFSINSYGEDLSPEGRNGYPDSQAIGSVNINWNLYNGDKNTNNIAIYRAKANQNLMALEDLKLQIKLQYENAKEDLTTANLNFETASKALTSAKLNYEIVSNKVKEGISTNSDLIDANYLLTNSKQNYFSAFYNRYFAAATLKRVLEQ